MTTNPIADLPLPGKVTELVDLLTARLQITPTVTHNRAAGAWRIEASNDRARVTFDLRLTRRGVRQMRSTLAVDGAPHRLAADIDELAALFGIPTTPDQAAPPLVLEPLPDGYQLPALAASILTQLRHAPHLTVHTGLHDGKLTVAIAVPDDGSNGTLYVAFARARGRWTIGSLRLVDAHGVERSLPSGADLTQALQLLTGTPGGEASAPTSIGRPQAARANTGVQVRKTTVIRV
jgi:hypothetical protein